MAIRFYSSPEDFANARILGVINCDGCGREWPKMHPSQRWCSECSRELKRAQDRAYAAKNAESNRRRVREWIAANPERARETRRVFREKHPELVRQREAEKYRRNGEVVRARAKRWYAENRERVLAKCSSEEGRRIARERMRVKMKDPAFRLGASISRGIRASLSDKRRRSWESLVGYSLDDLRQHIERQFEKGMAWTNYGRGAGKWHIDHIVPRSAFTCVSADDSEFKACWALTNLRPMWGNLNIAKHANRTHLL
jgi:hypothetical protein